MVDSIAEIVTKVQTPNHYILTREAALILANEVERLREVVEEQGLSSKEAREEHREVLVELTELRELHRPRRTTDGEWPKDGQDVLTWNGSAWTDVLVGYRPEHTWLPAPAPPSDDTP